MSKAASAPKSLGGVQALAGGAGVSSEEVAGLREALQALVRETHSWRSQTALQDVLYLPAASKSAKPAADKAKRAGVAALSAQLSQILVAPPMLSLSERGGVKEWEAKWASRNEKLDEIHKRALRQQAK